jgi:hypothetical protein
MRDTIVREFAKVLRKRGEKIGPIDLIPYPGVGDDASWLTMSELLLNEELSEREVTIIFLQFLICFNTAGQLTVSHAIHLLRAYKDYLIAYDMAAENETDTN